MCDKRSEAIIVKVEKRAVTTCLGVEQKENRASFSQISSICLYLGDISISKTLLCDS